MIVFKSSCHYIIHQGYIKNASDVPPGLPYFCWSNGTLFHDLRISLVICVFVFFVRGWLVIHTKRVYLVQVPYPPLECCTTIITILAASSKAYSLSVLLLTTVCLTMECWHSMCRNLAGLVHRKKKNALQIVSVVWHEIRAKIRSHVLMTVYTQGSPFDVRKEETFISITNAV